MTTVTHVPVSGFAAPPAPAAPEVPSGFQVPPAGEPPRLPGNGTPVALPGQVPGFVPQPGQPGYQPPAASPAAPDALALLQQALNNQAKAPAASPVGETPAWLQDSLQKFDVDKIDDPIIKSMATALQVMGTNLDLDRALGRALAAGDPSLVDVRYIAEAGGPQAQQLAEIAKGIVTAVQAKANAVTASVHALVGGEAQWNAAVAAFNTAAPAELRLAVKSLLDSTSEAHIQAGAKLVAEFGKTSGLLPQVGAPLLGTMQAGQVGGQGLTKTQFVVELQKLDRSARDYSEQRDSLFARRALGKRAGL